jgi:hypothetical protein
MKYAAAFPQRMARRFLNETNNSHLAANLHSIAMNIEQQRSVPIHNHQPKGSGMKYIQRCECIDRGAIDYFPEIDIFIRSVRHRE